MAVDYPIHLWIIKSMGCCFKNCPLWEVLSEWGCGTGIAANTCILCDEAIDILPPPY